jgi:3-deoxy-7-phosphoheptulonate synthase
VNADRIEDRNVRAIRPLAAPEALKAKWPLDEAGCALVAAARAEIRQMVRGDSARLLVVVGPCSIHDPEAALEYAQRLRPIALRTAEQLLVVMRVYFEKPRTTVGWKGFLNDPHLDGSCDLAWGLEAGRRLLLEIAALGLPCGGELLDPISPQYLSDLYSWAAIGARTSESQTHRELVSGASMPVGFKNTTAGSIEVAANAVIAARQPHVFLGVDRAGRAAVVETLGNDAGHLILRGGAAGPNHGPRDLRAAAAACPDRRRPVMVDCSHGNSGKDPHRQGLVLRDVLEHTPPGLASPLLGFMLESHLCEGRQEWSPGAPLRRGVSITDACLGFAETEALLDFAAGVVAGR